MNRSYSEALRFLYGLRLFGTKLGLENTFRLVALAGNPHLSLRFIHVAGTNGKGSTCAMLESIYRSAGLKVGLFTSPHLVSFRERIQVNRQRISEEDVVRLLEEMRPSLAEFSTSRHPTFFEVVTVMALRYFAEQRCDLVIWETGLGGRLDATNIVTPLASIITNIQLDHEKWLGSTLPEIAAEKAGIIKAGVPIITSAEGEALRVIERSAAQMKAPLFRLTVADTRTSPLDQIRLALLGEHQKMNAALALHAVRVVDPQIPVAEQSVRIGLEQVRWPGRLQLERISPGRAVLLDGAHNPAGAATLRDALQTYFPTQRPALVLGILRDKDWAGICQSLVPLALRVFLSPVSSERTALPFELMTVCKAANPEAEVECCDSLGQALERAADEPFVVITGSLHFVGEAMEWLKLAPSAPDERRLNEWDASAQLTHSDRRLTSVKG
jgi:dihydrofolate synthase/folylpolyglutamate synthase